MTDEKIKKSERHCEVFRELMRQLKDAKPRKLSNAIEEVAYRTAVWDVAGLVVREQEAIADA